jgi:hypothetical protein
MVILVLLNELDYSIQNVIENVNDYPNDLDQFLIDYFRNDYDF